MAGIGEVASVVGVIALGIQTAQILQKEIDAVLGADQRIQQMVIEIQATAHFLNDLKQYVAPGSRVSRRTKREYEIIIRQCNIVFRRVIILIAKAGGKVLSGVDEYQQRTSEGEDPKTLELQVQLCRLESLNWPWKMKKIEQCIADLDRLKRGLNDRLTIANAAQAQGRPLNEDSDSVDEGDIDDGEEVFDSNSMMLPIIDVIEQDDSAFFYPSTHPYSGEVADYFAQTTHRKSHTSKHWSDRQQRHRRQRDQTSVDPPAGEVISVVDHTGLEGSSQYEWYSDSSQSIDGSYERQSGRRGHMKQRRHQDRRDRNGKPDESRQENCTIS